MFEWKTLASGILVDVIWLIKTHPSTGLVILPYYSCDTSSDKELDVDLIPQIPNQLNIWQQFHAKTE